MNKVEIQKELFRSKAIAKFSHYNKGRLFYNIQLESGLHQFPIFVVEDATIDLEEENLSLPTIQLALDLGETSFKSEIKASELNRWIGKAVDNEQFINILPKAEVPVKSKISDEPFYVDGEVHRR